MSSEVAAEPDTTSSAVSAAEQQEETTAPVSEQREEDATESPEAREGEKVDTTEEGGEVEDKGMEVVQEETEEEVGEKQQGKEEAKAKEEAEQAKEGAKEEAEEGAKEEAREECNGKEGSEKVEAAQSARKKASPLEEKIIRQVEFYFGDRNFPKDKFLQQTVESSTDGWVPLTTLLTFNRLKALSSDVEVIAVALRKSCNGIVEVNEDGKSVRRHPDNAVPDIFDPEFRKEMTDRTIYAKGFPENTQLDQIQEFIDQYGKVHLIHMRRLRLDNEKKFKGSVFVEFVSVEDAEKFVKSEKVQFNGIDLVIEWKSDYFKRKEEERKRKKEEKRSNASSKTGGEDGAKEVGKSVVKVSGAILQFTGLEGEKTREDLREDLLQFGTVAFVDFDQGKTEGYVRFREEGGAQRAREGLLGRAVGGMGVAQLCGSGVELKVLEGEEEEQYWHKVIDGSGGGKERRGGRGGRRGWGGRGRGGRGRGRGSARKRRDRSSAGEGEGHPPESKVQKTAED